MKGPRIELTPRTRVKECLLPWGCNFGKPRPCHGMCQSATSLRGTCAGWYCCGLRAVSKQKILLIKQHVSCSWPPPLQHLDPPRPLFPARRFHLNAVYFCSCLTLNLALKKNFFIFIIFYIYLFTFLFTYLFILPHRSSPLP